MEITLFGLIWIFISVTLFLFFPLIRLAQLVVISCIFQSAAIILVGGSAISPLLFTSFSFVTKCLIITLQNFSIKNLKINIPIWGVYLVLFFLYSLIGVVIFPFIFKGIKVFPMTSGIDANVYSGGEPLGYSTSSIFQIILLIVYVSCVFYLYKYREVISFSNLIKAFYFSIFLVLLIGFWSYISKQFNLIPFPDSFFYNNSLRSKLTNVHLFGLVRYTSTFTEASIAGGFLAASFWGLVMLNFRWKKFILVIVGLALLLTMSGTGYVALVGGLSLYIIWNSRKYTLYVVLVIFLLIGILLTTDLYSIIESLVVDKINSQSGFSRFSADIFSFNLLIKTCFLGVGVGNHRSSSFLFTMLANVGLPGVLFLTLFLCERIKQLFHFSEQDNNARFLLMYTLVFTFTQVLSNPDLSSPTFWMWIFIAVVIPSSGNQNTQIVTTEE